MIITKKHPTKVSYGLLIFIFLVFYGPIIPVIINGELNRKIIGLIAFLSLVFGFILHLFLGTYYTIEHHKLKIKCGRFSYQPIEIDQIKEVSKTNNIISSPAPSFDRIAIKYGNSNVIIISPKDKLNFVNDLIAINPKIKNSIAV